MTIKEIKEQCREAIKVEEAADPRCLRGGFSPNAARALLDLITYAEEDLEYPPLNLRAREALNKICTNWTL
jgi:hypothetical protein